MTVFLAPDKATVIPDAAIRGTNVVDHRREIFAKEGQEVTVHPYMVDSHPARKPWPPAAVEVDEGEVPVACQIGAG